KGREEYPLYWQRATDPAQLRGVWPEEVSSLENFFGSLGGRLYRFPVGTINEWNGSNPAPDRFALFTNHEYPELDESIRNRYDIAVYRFPYAPPGFLGKLAAWYHRTAKWLGRSDLIMIDRCAAPRFKVMVFTRGEHPRHSEVPVVDVSFGSIAHY